MSEDEWLAGNQRVLVAEFARIKCILAGELTPAVLRELAGARAALSAPASLDVLINAFDLSDFERDVLLLSAGVELDTGIAGACANFGDASQAWATFGIALSKFDEPHWSALAPIRPLRAAHLINLRDERTVTSSRIDIDERVLHFLAGINYLDSRLRALLRELPDSEVLLPSHEAVVEKATAALNAASPRIRIQLLGDDLQSASEIARSAAARVGQRVHLLRASDIPALPHEAETLASLWSRDARLLRSILLVQLDGLRDSAVARFLDFVTSPVLTCGNQATECQYTATLRIDRPAVGEQKGLWAKLLGDRGGNLNGSLDAVAAQFRLDGAAIARAASALLAEPAVLDRRSLWRACRETTRKQLDGIATRVESAVTWENLVLPEQQTASLRQIAAHVRQRLKVYEEWGFAKKGSRGLGISVLFSGESGTGKTMAAEVLANELDLDLFRIDLATVVSKYIGETEKNLRQIFDAADDSGAILLFDEADALFGKRGEVKDGQDRFANIEVSYLLQRMESYRGLAILTTNLKNSIDRAFMRRLRFLVQFPFPDQEMRERIWRGAFPPMAPTEFIDHQKLAQLNVPGGNIRNIALNAAFLAADAQEPVRMNHLLQAARNEASKRDRPYSEAETRGWL